MALKQNEHVGSIQTEPSKKKKKNVWGVLWVFSLMQDWLDIIEEGIYELY